MSDEEAQDFGFREAGPKNGMFFPYLDPSAGHASERFGRLKPSGQTAGRKYLQPVGETNHLYFPPGTTLADLQDPAVEILLIEGEKKSLAVLAWAQRRGCRCVPIGLGGCWSWRRQVRGELPDGSLGRVGSEAIPDLNLIAWADRKVTIGFDGDVTTNADVARAESSLAGELRGHGARVFAIRIPPDPHGRRRGADDLLTQEGDPAWEAVLDTARPMSTTDDTVTDIIQEAGLDAIGEATTLEQVECALRKLGPLLDGADPLRRTMVREAAVRALSRAGLKSPAGAVDAILCSLQPDAPGDRQGRPLVMNDPEPWPGPVEGAHLLDEIQGTLGRYLVLPPGGAAAIALWILHSHTFKASQTSPFLCLKSPTKRAGKTRALTIVAGLTPRALPTSNISPAALFRTVEAYAPTLLVDEADSFLSLSEELRGILNSGHTPSTATIIRTVGDDHEPRCFSTWCPKTIALIGNLPDTLQDRSIIVPMRRKTKREKVERLRLHRLQRELEPLRRKARRWGEDYRDRLRDASPSLPEQLNDRAADNWEPLVAIADLVGGDWPREARQAALRLSGAADDSDTSEGIRLLADIRDLFRARNDDRLSSEQIVEALSSLEDRPWPEWRKGHPITKNQLAALLRPFEIKPKTIRLHDDTTPRGYLLEDFADAFSRYLPDQVQQPQQSSDDGPSSRSSERNADPLVAPHRTYEKPRQLALVAPVAPRIGDAEMREDGHPSGWGQAQDWEEF